MRSDEELSFVYTAFGPDVLCYGGNEIIDAALTARLKSGGSQRLSQMSEVLGRMCRCDHDAGHPRPGGKPLYSPDVERFERVSVVERLASSITHEINQPLGAATTFINAAMRWLSLPTPNLDEARSALTRAAEQISRITRVVNPVKALTQVSLSGEFRCDAVESVRNVLPLLQGQLRERGIEISLFDLTQSDTSEVAVHCTEVSQILLNLITNSIDAVSQNIGDRLISIRLSRCTRKMLRIEVEDNGSGIVVADTQSVFEPFYSTKSAGTGLGLPITLAIIERCKGSIEIKSEPGRGTLVTVLLPLSEPAG